MRIKQKLASTAALGALALAVAGPAVATGNAYTVSVGGSSAPGTHPITASAPSTLIWQVPTLSMTCSSASVPASPASAVTSGAGVTDIFAINKVNFVGCTLPGGALAVTTSGPWTFRGNSAAGPSAADVVTGSLDGFKATWANAVCKFTVTGSPASSFDESTQKFAINETGFTGNLKVSNAIGCLGKITNGQDFNLTATFNVSSVDGAINLS